MCSMLAMNNKPKAIKKTHKHEIESVNWFLNYSNALCLELYSHYLSFGLLRPKPFYQNKVAKDIGFKHLLEPVGSDLVNLGQ